MENTSPSRTSKLTESTARNPPEPNRDILCLEQDHRSRSDFA